MIRLRMHRLVSFITFTSWATRGRPSENKAKTYLPASFFSPPVVVYNCCSRGKVKQQQAMASPKIPLKVPLKAIEPLSSKVIRLLKALELKSFIWPY